MIHLLTMFLGWTRGPLPEDTTTRVYETGATSVSEGGGTDMAGSSGLESHHIRI